MVFLFFDYLFAVQKTAIVYGDFNSIIHVIFNPGLKLFAMVEIKIVSFKIIKKTETNEVKNK